jgi:hypothetical protein
MSSINLPRDLIEQDWFRYIATANPISYLVEGIRSLVITGWDAQALLLGFGCAFAIIALSVPGPRHSCARGWRADGAGGGFFSVAFRGGGAPGLQVLRQPGVPGAGVLPLFFFVAFAGGTHAGG